MSSWQAGGGLVERNKSGFGVFQRSPYRAGLEIHEDQMAPTAVAHGTDPIWVDAVQRQHTLRAASRPLFRPSNSRGIAPVGAKQPNEVEAP
jgi:hypothetical protein